MTTRRDIIGAGGLGLFSAVAAGAEVQAKAAKAAPAPAMTAAEKANVDLVKAFLAEFAKPDVDFAVVLKKYLSPTCSMRWADYQPAVYGPDAAAVQAQSLMPKGTSLSSVKYLNIFAKGPLVATSRIDTISTLGKPSADFHCAGVHVIKDGKFVEYCDYILT